MKLVAHSLVPPTPVPYLHMGYLSAAANERTTHPPGYAFLISGAILATMLGVIIFRKGISPVARRCGWGLLLAGIVVFGLAQIPCPLHYVHPEEASQDHAWKVYKRITVTREPGARLPSDLHTIAQTFPYTKDGWNREMHIITYQSKGTEAYAVVSAGRDGKFGTGDDIAVTEGSSPIYSRKHKVVIPELTDALVERK